MRLAAFTMVKNENIFLPIWMKHYRRYFKEDDIYILDNDTDDGSTDEYENVIKIPCERSFNNRFMRATVQTFQRKLLDNYDYVLFTEVDEIVLPIECNAFDEFITSTGNQKSYTCSGYEIVQKIGIESDIDLSQPLLKQRSRMYKSGIYCKTLLTRVPVYYSMGYHSSSMDNKINSGLILIHLHKIDFKINTERNIHRLNKPVDEQEKKNKHGWQCYTLDEKRLVEFFNQKHVPLSDYEEIPEKFKHII